MLIKVQCLRQMSYILVTLGQNKTDVIFIKVFLKFTFAFNM